MEYDNNSRQPNNNSRQPKVNGHQAKRSAACVRVRERVYAPRAQRAPNARPRRACALTYKNVEKNLVIQDFLATFAAQKRHQGGGVRIIFFLHMAIVNPVTGKMRGKIAGMVYAVTHGVNTVRAAAENVSNPSTPAQVAARAKMKLLSQLSANIESVIAIPRDGIKTPRNLFTSSNYKYTGYDQAQATIELADVQLTKSAVGLAGFTADRSSGTKIDVHLEEDMSMKFQKIVYVVLKRNSSNVVEPFASVVASDAGADGEFPASLPYTGDAISVHAYGINERTAQARIAFGNLTAPSAESVAKVVTSKQLKSSDYQLSETRGVYMAAGETATETTGTARVRIQVVMVNANGGEVSTLGSVSGAGSYDVGAAVALTATPAQDARFVGWRESAAGENISTSATLNVTAEEAKTYYAVFAPIAATRVVSLGRTSGAQNLGTLSGGGSYEVGDTVTVDVSGVSGNQFFGWYDGSDIGTASKVSQNKQYSFEMPDHDVSLYAYTVNQGD